MLRSPGFSPKEGGQSRDKSEAEQSAFLNYTLAQNRGNCAVPDLCGPLDLRWCAVAPFAIRIDCWQSRIRSDGELLRGGAGAGARKSSR